jgi:tRNA pseudouridine38-40 synthase
MRFLKLVLAYEGTHYAGWQVQPNGVSVQEVFETVWRQVTGEDRRIIASGRTDAGVHALAQVCSLETGSSLSGERLVAALNAGLPSDIRVLTVDEAPANFHAIRDAVKKTYLYRIQHGRHADLFQRSYAWHVPVTLDVTKMEQAATFLRGRHDFSAFEATGSERRDAIRHIFALSASAQERGPFREIRIEVTADGFLYNMVRNIVGTLVMVGRGKYPPEWVQEVLDSQDRSRAGPTAPAHGLFLVSVEYAR